MIDQLDSWQTMTNLVPCVSQAFYDQQRDILLHEVSPCKHGLDASRILQCLLQALRNAFSAHFIAAALDVEASQICGAAGGGAGESCRLCAARSAE